MLLHVQEIEGTPSYSESRPYSWQCRCDYLHRDNQSIWSKCWQKLFSLKLVYREPSTSIILEILIQIIIVRVYSLRETILLIFLLQVLSVLPGLPCKSLKQQHCVKKSSSKVFYLHVQYIRKSQMTEPNCLLYKLNSKLRCLQDLDHCVNRNRCPCAACAVCLYISFQGDLNFRIMEVNRGSLQTS